ncbi:MAG TPA: glutathione S-transferase family protein [Caulobacteraceae bacterium]
MIVFGSPLSPFVRKVHVFAAEKGVEIAEGATRGPEPLAEFLAASPFRKIPALQHGDFDLADSSAIVAYMEKLHPEPALIPTEAKAHAKTIWFEEVADTILGPATIAVFFNRVLARRFGREPDLAAADRAESEQLPPAFAYLETAVPASGFLVADRFTLADIAVASFFVNLSYVQIAPDPKAQPRLAAYIAGILGRPSFQRLIESDKVALQPAA